MAMKTHIRAQGNSIIVSLEGNLDFETTDQLKENLQKLQSQIKTRTNSSSFQVVFDLSELQFVGSSGISAFIQTLREFNTCLPVRPRYAHVKPEFKKIITAFDNEKTFEFWDTTERALRSFDN